MAALTTSFQSAFPGRRHLWKGARDGDLQPFAQGLGLALSGLVVVLREDDGPDAGKETCGEADLLALASRGRPAVQRNAWPAGHRSIWARLSASTAPSVTTRVSRSPAVPAQTANKLRDPPVTKRLAPSGGPISKLVSLRFRSRWAKRRRPPRSRRISGGRRRAFPAGCRVRRAIPAPDPAWPRSRRPGSRADVGEGESAERMRELLAHMPEENEHRMP